MWYYVYINHAFCHDIDTIIKIDHIYVLTYRKYNDLRSCTVYSLRESIVTDMYSTLTYREYTDLHAEYSDLHNM